MRDGRMKCAIESLPTFLLHGYADSHVVSVWEKGADAPNSPRALTAEAIAHDMLIQELWEADKHVLHSLLDAEDVCDRPGSLSLSFFRTDQERMVFGPKGIRPGDILWVLPGYPSLFAIIRDCGGVFKVVGRACCFSKGVGEKWEIDEERQIQGSRDSMVLEISMAELQVLTCPLLSGVARRINSDHSPIKAQKKKSVKNWFGGTFRHWFWKRKKSQ